jgi:hypothetical protein
MRVNHFLPHPSPDLVPAYLTSCCHRLLALSCWDPGDLIINLPSHQKTHGYRYPHLLYFPVVFTSSLYLSPPSSPPDLIC